MSEPEEDDLPFQRSSIGAIGARKRWRCFGRTRTRTAEPDAAGAEDDGPTGHSMLGNLARQAEPPEPAAAPSSLFARQGGRRTVRRSTACSETLPATAGRCRKPRRSRVALFGRGGGRRRPAVPQHARRPRQPERADAGARRGSEVDALARSAPERPLRRRRSGSVRRRAAPHPPSAIAHSTIAELAGLEEHDVGTFPDRARDPHLAHLPPAARDRSCSSMPRDQPGSKEDLFARLVPQPKDDTPIPVIFSDAPGPAQPNPKSSPLSDADRRAGGGDPSRPKADTPFVPPSQRRRGARARAQGARAFPGQRRARRARAPRPRRERRAAAGARRDSGPEAVGVSDDSAAADARGPREVGKLAGLDRAIRGGGARHRGRRGRRPAGQSGRRLRRHRARSRSTRPGTTGAPTRPR